MRVAIVCGVDGCRAGWVVVTARTHPFRVLSVEMVADIAEVIARPVDLVAVDMPIGLDARRSRACDLMARSMLGPRRGSVFPAPFRPVLDAVDYHDALARSRAAGGVGLSIQAWNLVPKIARLDALMTPALQERVREAHPELAFARLAGTPMSTHKSEPAGRAERVSVIGEPPVLAGARRSDVAPDDVVDASVLARTAADLLAGDALTVGDGSLDDNGLRMEITG